MGVTGLWKLIEQSGKPVPLDTLENKVLAVDISIWLHQVVKGFQDSNGATLPNAHLLGLFHRLCKLMYYRIKPIFVFDGGVPLLKRETIAKRARNKSKYQNEADKLSQLLLEAMAKEKVVQEALGPSTSLLISNVSPKKSIKIFEENTEDDLFKLPPIKEDASINTDESMTDLTESDSSFDEKHRTQYNQSLQSIDVKSSYFQSLPADIRHEILSDIKETRKQSSWGRLHELPAESQSFSNFQMKRLLKRRQVQVELEGAEKEMGGKGLSMAELEQLMAEEGVVDVDLAAHRIASNEHVRYLHVRDITKAMKKDANEKVEFEIKKMDPQAELDEKLDIERAIQLPLSNEDQIGTEGNVENSNEQLKLTTSQRKVLGPSASSLARSYMIEYGGLNDDEISDLVKLDESLPSTSDFKYNDSSVLPNYESRSHVVCSAKENSKIEETVDLSNESEISSDVESDLIEVPEADIDIENILISNSKKPLPSPFLMNEPPLPPSSDSEQFSIDWTKNTKIEVSIDPNSLCPAEDDIFADIFKPIQSNYKDRHMQMNQACGENLTDDNELKNSCEKTKNAEIIENSKMINILKDLNDEMTNVVSLRSDQLFRESPLQNNESKTETIVINKNTAEHITIQKMSQIQTTPTKKIPQPFFVRKTPPSSKKKQSPSSGDTTNYEKNDSPTKIVKSLSQSFELMPKISMDDEILNENVTIRRAAQVLREKKSENELKDIAIQLNQERHDLTSEINKKDRMGVSITEQMSMECMELLRLFGVPYIVAKMEAEAQCAYLNEINLTDGTITDDSDIWLFGGKTVYKNFFDQNKLVMEFKSCNIEKLFHLDRRKLIQLSFLVGSDYTQGIHGIGAVTALEVLSIFGSTPEKHGETTEIMSTLSSLRKFREWWLHKTATQKTLALRNKLKNITISEEFPNPRVVEAYLFPTVDENREKFTWGQPEVESIREYAKKTFGWTNKRTDDVILPVMKRINEKKSQKSIENYFKTTGVTSRTDLKVSKRVRNALNQMSGDPNATTSTEEVIERKKTKKKASKDEIKAAKLKIDNNGEVDKLKRKRKAKTALNNIDEPSTSKTTKKIVLPDNNEPIPQREKDKEIMISNKLKAIETLKGVKK